MKHRSFIFLLFIIYMFITTALMIQQGIGLAPDRYSLVLLLGSLLVKRTRSFLIDWIPFLLILISYDFLRGLAYRPGIYVHYLEPIRADEQLFGVLPTAALQQLFYNPGRLNWYDWGSTILYFLHFVLPLSFAFLLWLHNKRHFREFITGLSILSYAAWATFLILPTAPPWLAARDGYVTGVNKILDTTLQFFPSRIDLPTIYHKINPNPVAAVPSLHAAYPMLVLLFGLKFFKFKALLFLPYVAAVWISIVYLGEHYVIDVVIGIFYAITFYLLTAEVLHRIDWHQTALKLLPKTAFQKAQLARIFERDHEPKNN